MGRQQGIGRYRALRIADEVMPEMTELIRLEFPNASKRFHQVLIFRCYGFGVGEIARHFRTYRKAIYRILEKAQRHVSQTNKFVGT